MGRQSQGPLRCIGPRTKEQCVKRSVLVLVVSYQCANTAQTFWYYVAKKARTRAPKNVSNANVIPGCSTRKQEWL